MKKLASLSALALGLMLLAAAPALTAGRLATALGLDVPDVTTPEERA